MFPSPLLINRVRLTLNSALVACLVAATPLAAQTPVAVCSLPQGSRVNLAQLPKTLGKTIVKVNGHVPAEGDLSIPLLQRREVRLTLQSGGSTSDLDLVLIPQGLSVLTGAGQGGDGESQYRDGKGLAARFYNLGSITKGPDGSLYVVDYHAIRKIDTEGKVSTLAGSVLELGTVDSTTDAKGQATNAGQERFKLWSTSQIAVDGQGGVYVADYGNGALRYISPTGVVRTVAGELGNTNYNSAWYEVNSGDKGPDGLVHPKGLLRNPKGLCLLSTGEVVFQEFANWYLSGKAYAADRYVTRKYTPATGQLSTYYTCSTNTIWAGLDTFFNDRHQYALCRGENLLTDGTAVYQVQDATAQNSLLYPLGSQVSYFPVGFFDPKLLNPSCIYYSSACFVGSAVWFTSATTPNAQVTAYRGLSDVLPTKVYGTGGGRTTDGNPAEAGFDLPMGICQGGDGAMYVADRQAIRRIDSDGVVTHWAGLSASGADNGAPDGSLLGARFYGQLNSLTVTPDGTILVPDPNNQTLRRVSNYRQLGATVTTVMGKYRTSGTQATDGSLLFNKPRAVTSAPDGTVYLADYMNKRICQRTPAGQGSVALQLSFYPDAIAWAGTSQLYIKDSADKVYLADLGKGSVTALTTVSSAGSYVMASDAKGVLYTASYAGELRRWVLGAQGWTATVLPKLNGTPCALAVNPAGTKLYCALKAYRATTDGKSSAACNLVFYLKALADGTWALGTSGDSYREPGQILGRRAESAGQGYLFNGPAPLSASQAAPSLAFPSTSFSMAVNPLSGDLLIPSAYGILLVSGQ